MEISEIQNQKEMRIKKYDVALATRNFEIELFWRRSLFFWGFIASAFIGYSALIKAESSLAVVIACFGFICSLSWTLVNRGSKRWQENWEVIVSEIEDDVTGSLFKETREKENKHFWLGARKFSVSKITIALSDFTVMIWVSLMGHHLMKLCQISLSVSVNNIFYILAIIGSILFAIAMVYFGKSSD